MNRLIKVARYEVRDVLRSRWLLGYTVFLLLVTDALLRFGGAGERALLSLVNVVLFVVPLVSLVFSTVYLYNAREFIELMLAQPLRRKQLFGGIFAGLAAPLSLALAIGLSAPAALHFTDNPVDPATLAVLLGTGILLTLVFTAIAFFVVARVDDRMKGLGITIALWLLFAILYDGIVLLLISIFSDYPLEKPLLGLMAANPVDLARVALLLRFDAAALLGYTGAVMKEFFGGSKGTFIAATLLAIWAVIPGAIGLRAFERKDF